LGAIDEIKEVSKTGVLFIFFQNLEVESDFTLFYGYELAFENLTNQVQRYV
jgi:hypothetical protein